MCDPVDSRSGIRRRSKLGKKTETFLPYESFLPDDVLKHILSWLPAKDVLRSRCVCRRWSDLTSTKDFIDLLMEHMFSMIVKEYKWEALLDRCLEPRSNIVHRPDHDGIALSHLGLLIARGWKFFNDSYSHEGDFVIYNPLYSDVVKIIVPAKPNKGMVCGAFLHHRKHCILWQKTLSLKPRRVQYKIISLASDQKCRDIRNPSNQNGRILGIQTVLFDKYLYWMVEPSEYFSCFEDSTFNCDIIEYDIRKEEFRLIPCPVPISVKHFNYNVNLIDFDGVISLVQVFPSKESVEINIWTLKDDGEQVWTCSNYIVSSDVYPGYGFPKAIRFRKGELVLQSDGRLCVCNLKLGTYRKFGQKYNYELKFLSHVMSHRNYKICIVDDDDENYQPIERGRGEAIQALG